MKFIQCGNTEKAFNEAIVSCAKYIKYINDNGYSDKQINELYEQIKEYKIKLMNLPYDFKITDFKKYIKNVLGEDYFSDKRYWSYLYTIIYEIEDNIGRQSL